MTFIENRRKKTQKKVKTGLVILALATTMLSTVPVYAADNDKEWTIGFDEDKNGPVEGEQGGNGWYFMYSSERNTDGVLDTSKIKECEWADRGSCWMAYGYGNMWMPDIYAAEDYDCYERGNWWRMDCKGAMDPNAGNDAVRSVVAWEAPESGTYSINLDYTAGTGSYEWEGETYYYDDGDGVTLSINTEKDVVEKVHCETVTEEKPDLPTGNLTAEVELKKGEKLYVSADPGENGGCDAAVIKMDIKQTKAAGMSADKIILIVIIAVLIGGSVLLTVAVSQRKKKLRN